MKALLLTVLVLRGAIGSVVAQKEILRACYTRPRHTWLLKMLDT